MRVLCLDGGSSSLKFAVYDIDDTGQRRLLKGEIEPLGTPNITVAIRDERNAAATECSIPLGDASPVDAVLAALNSRAIAVDAIGHRVVYGGPTFSEPVRVTDAILAQLTTLVAFDRLHMPAALATIREVASRMTAIPQVVCFDTAFHHNMPAVAQRTALPRALFAEGVRRYGFHGLSYESICLQLGTAGSRGAMIVAHLGGGASLAAIRDGKPIDTTMGFTPLGGLVMGTRPGDLDPGIILYLLRERQYSTDELDAVLSERSGLLGISGRSSDMRALLRDRSASAAAAEAVDLFVYQAVKHIGALTASLGGLETLVFTGGIGERSAVIRSEIASGLAHLGIAIDSTRNDMDASVISTDKSLVCVRMIASNENLMVARHTFAAIRRQND